MSSELNWEFQPYLLAMDIPIWQCRLQVPQVELSNDHLLQHFLLKNSDQVVVAGLMIDRIAEDDTAAQTLLEAMLSAIKLTLHPIAQRHPMLEGKDTSVQLQLLMGKVAVQQQLHADSEDLSLRQRSHRLATDQRAIITDHPTLLQQQPDKKRRAWNDLQYFATFIETR